MFLNNLVIEAPTISFENVNSEELLVPDQEFRMRMGYKQFPDILERQYIIKFSSSKPQADNKALTILLGGTLLLFLSILVFCLLSFKRAYKSEPESDNMMKQTLIKTQADEAV